MPRALQLCYWDSFLKNLASLLSVSAELGHITPLLETLQGCPASEQKLKIYRSVLNLVQNSLPASSGRSARSPLQSTGLASLLLAEPAWRRLPWGLCPLFPAPPTSSSPAPGSLPPLLPPFPRLCLLAGVFPEHPCEGAPGIPGPSSPCRTSVVLVLVLGFASW